MEYLCDQEFMSSLLVDDDLYIEEDHPMSGKPTPTDRLNILEPRIADLEQALGISGVPISTRAKVWRILKDNGTPIGVLITIIGIFATILVPRWLDARTESFNNSVDQRVEKVLKEPGGVVQTLTDVKTASDKTNATLMALQPFMQDVIARRFDAVSKLSPQSLGGNLPSVSDLLNAAREEKVVVNSQAVEAIKRNLGKVPDSAGAYWPVVGQLISYQTGFQSSMANLPNCDGTTVVYRGGPDTKDMVGDVFISNCFLDLDAPEIWTLSASGARAQVNGQTISQYHLYIQGALVHYSGKPLPHVGLVEFDHCILDFHLNASPESPAGQSFVKQLLAQNNLSKIRIPLS